jgi:hypothetical protein
MSNEAKTTWEDNEGEKGGQYLAHSSSDDELGSLSGNAEARLEREQKRRDQYVIEAVDTLVIILLIVGFSLISANILVLVDQNVDMEIPLWSIFTVLWVGQFAILIAALYAVRMMLKAMIIKVKRGKRLAQKWHHANEKRIPLVQYVLIHLGTVLGVSFVVAIFEINLYFALAGMISKYVPLGIAYAITGFSFLGSILCKSQADLYSMGAWGMALLFVILLNVKFSNDSMPWGAVLFPLFVLTGAPLVVIASIIVKYLMRNYLLKPYQLEALCLLIVSFTCYLLAVVSIANAVHGYMIFDIPYSEMATILTLVGSLLFFVAVWRITVEALATAIVRMGSDRPKPLVRLPGGGWELDLEETFELFPIIGEIEVRNDGTNNSGKKKGNRGSTLMCGCCAAVQMMTFGKSGGMYDSDEDEETGVTSAMLGGDRAALRRASDLKDPERYAVGGSTFKDEAETAASRPESARLLGSAPKTKVASWANRTV